MARVGEEAPGFFSPGGAGLFSFFGNEPTGYEALLHRRKIAEALAAQKKGMPKNVGEGLTYLGESIGEAGLNWRLRQAEAEQAKQEAGISGGVPRTGGYQTDTSAAPVVTSAPRAAAPAPRAAIEPDPAVTETVAAAEDGTKALPATLSYAPEAPRDLPPEETAAPAASAPVTVRPAPTPRQPVTPFFDSAIPLSGGGGTSLRPAELVSLDSEGANIPPENRAGLQAGLQRVGSQRLAETQGNALFDPNPTGGTPTTFQPGSPALASSSFRGEEPVRDAGYNEIDAAAPTLTADVPLPSSRPAPQVAAAGRERGVYDPGELNPIDQAAVNRSNPMVRGVNPRLVEAVNAGALSLPDGYRVRISSGQREGDSGFHGRHAAVDVKIIDPNGDEILSKGPDKTGLYTQLARGAYTHALKNDEHIAWGGAFDTSKQGGTGNRDLMHFDTGPERGNLDPSLRLSRLGALPADFDPNAPGGAGTQIAARTPREAVQNAMSIVQARDAPPSPSDAGQVARVQDVVGMGGAGARMPATASLGRTGVASDAPPLGVNPVNADPEIARSIEQRNAIAKGLLDQEQKVPAPEVPATGPTQAGTAASPSSTTTDNSLAATSAAATSALPKVAEAAPAPSGRVTDIPAAPSWFNQPSLQPFPKAPAPAEARPPSQDPIPPLPDEEMAHPGDPPPRPKPLGLSPIQKYWQPYIDNPNVSLALRKRAEREYGTEEIFRKSLESAQQNDYVDQRERYQKKIDEYDKFQREKPARQLDAQIKRSTLEEFQAKAERRPVDLAKAQADLEESRLKVEEMYYKRGIPREQARQQADLAIAEARRKVNAPTEHVIGGAVYRAPVDPATGETGSYALAPGSPPPEPKNRTAEQDKALEFVIRTKPDLEKVEKQLNNGKAMTYFKDDVLAARLPFGLDNKAVSAEYRTAKQALMNWGTAYMTHVSGASYGEKEMMRTLSGFLPAYGDTDEDLAAKAQRRRVVTEGAAQISGPGGLAILEQMNRDYEGGRPPVKIQTREDIDKMELNPGRHVILPNGDVRVVPPQKKKAP